MTLSCPPVEIHQQGVLTCSFKRSDWSMGHASVSWKQNDSMLIRCGTQQECTSLNYNFNGKIRETASHTLSTLFVNRVDTQFKKQLYCVVEINAHLYKKYCNTIVYGKFPPLFALHLHRLFLSNIYSGIRG